jgi:hypothetical protein
MYWHQHASKAVHLYAAMRSATVQAKVSLAVMRGQPRMNMADLVVIPFNARVHEADVEAEGNVA